MCNNINKKILENKNLINYTINKYFPGKKKDDDIYQVGMIALWKAIQHNEKNQNNNANFSTYAVSCIKNEIIKELQKEQAQKRTLADGMTAVYLDSANTSSDGEIQRCGDIIGYEGIPFIELGINEYSSKQSKRRKDILKLISMGYSLKDIAKILKVSKTTIYNEWISIKKDLSRIC